MQSGMTYTILRPNFLMEVWLSSRLGFDFLNANATIYGAGNNKVSWISQGDVATFAVASLDNPAACDATLGARWPGGIDATGSCTDL